MKKTGVTPVDIAAKFELSELFFSTTDAKGRITSCNDVFTRIANYEPSELLGAPHNIIRHPDMPKCVFSLLWEHLLSGRCISAYVKNMTSDGAYYWVLALALPIDEGFLSIRLKPSTDTLGLVQGLYKRLLDVEAGFGSRWREGMQASKELLLKTLAELGFETYEAFMAHTLRSEIALRNQTLADASQRAAQAQPMRRIFNDLDQLVNLRQSVGDQEAALKRVGHNVRRVALNASICAAQLSDQGRALGVISEQTAMVSEDISGQAQVLAKELGQLSGNLQTTSLQVSFSTLVSEMSTAFRAQSQASSLSSDEQIAAHGATYQALDAMLTRAYGSILTESARGAVGLRDTLRTFQSFNDRFSQILLTMRLSHVTGKSIAASISGAEQFSSLLEEMLEITEAARTKLGALESVVSQVGNTVGTWRLDKMSPNPGGR